MSKLVGNFRLDGEHREILKMRAASSGMNLSEYIRSMIERDNKGRFRRPSEDEYSEWESIRSSIKLSDSILSLLESMKKEYDDTETHHGTRVKNLKLLCKKYGLDFRIAKSDGENGFLSRKYLEIDQNSIRYIGKESNELEKSEFLGVFKEDTLEYVNFQKKFREIINNFTLEKALEKGISRRTFFYLKEKIANKKQIKLKKKILERIIHLC